MNVSVLGTEQDPMDASTSNAVDNYTSFESTSNYVGNLKCFVLKYFILIEFIQAIYPYIIIHIRLSFLFVFLLIHLLV